MSTAEVLSAAQGRLEDVEPQVTVHGQGLEALGLLGFSGISLKDKMKMREHQGPLKLTLDTLRALKPKAHAAPPQQA